MTSLSPRWFQKTLLDWFDQHGRKNLPWQKNKNPYRVWVSEIMLQQTQVTTVISYYERFMQRFPTIETLAAASEDEVLHYWTGLGYYSRARNLHRTAKIIVSEHHGIFPDEILDLTKLPGIGDSTAGAILSIAFQKTATILDGNVKRVLTRLYGITTWPGDKKNLDFLWKTAIQLTPKKRTADYSQAIMDIGATLCIRGKPHCEKCPFKKKCEAHQQGIEKKIPVTKPKKNLPIKQNTLLLITHNQHVLLQKRPPTGIWGSLWSFPELAGHTSIDEIKKYCKKNSISIKELSLESSFRHTFSHFHLEILPVLITTPKIPLKIQENEQQIWYKLDDTLQVGLPAPIKKLIRKLQHDTFN